MREMQNIKIKYLCQAFATSYAAKDLSKKPDGYPVYGAAGIMGYAPTYDSETEYLGIIKDGAGVGRIDKYPAKTSLLGTMTSIIPNDGISIDWLKYVVESLNLGETVDRTTIPHIYFSEYGNKAVRYVSRNEQAKIASFLNDKLGKVDRLVENEQKQIEKLKEYKQSVITEAVTKGLDKSAPMKDSGVDWLGQIPVGWEVVQISSIISERKNKNLGLVEQNLLSLSYGKVIKKNINTCEGLLPESFEGYNIIEKGDIVLRLTDLQNDQTSLRTGLCTERGIITSAYTTLIVNKNYAMPEFLHYALHSFDIYKGLYGMGSGVRQGLNYDGIKKILVALPSINIQKRICDYIICKCADIDKLIEIKRQKIDKLNEYRKSLIYEYVTGKKEVC